MIIRWSNPFRQLGSRPTRREWFPNWGSDPRTLRLDSLAGVSLQVLWSKGSSASIPFGTLLALLGLWFGISVPLTFIGAFFGFRRPVGCSFFLFRFGFSNKWRVVG